MKTEELKEKMSKLWKCVFHDTDAYISLVFDNYFDPDLVEYHEEDGKIISALLGIPYCFGNGKYIMRGLYLCGLATNEEYRHRGIMNNLIEKINKKAEEMGYAFTFLIPANDSLISYYNNRKYDTAIYRVENRYTDLHNFVKDYLSDIANEDEIIYKLKRKSFDSISTEIFDINNENILHLIIEFIYKLEREIYAYYQLMHSKKDIELMIKENILSGGEIFISNNKENMLTGVAFTTKDDHQRIRVPKVYYKDKGSLYRLLDCVKRRFPGSPISYYCYPEECERKLIWGKNYCLSSDTCGELDRVYNVGDHAKPYGMVRVLNIYEILKFIAEDRSDLKFSILVKYEENDETVRKFHIESGKIAEIEMDDQRLLDYVKYNNEIILSEREFVEILFRKKGLSNVIQEAFNIPRVPLNMALLLD